MRPGAHYNTTSTTAADSVLFHRWNSPIPYLFGGLALMLGLISISLIFLACSCKKKSYGENQDNNNNDKPAKTPEHVMKPEMEPKFVVIMAGDHNPTCLAKPTLCALDVC